MARIIVNEGEGPRSIALSAERTVVGSNPKCDVVLRHDSALGVRFAIERTPDGYRVDVIKGVVLLNETETRSAQLAHNDTLRIGESMVLFKEADRAGTGSAALQPDVGRIASHPPPGALDELPALEDVTAPGPVGATATPQAPPAPATADGPPDLDAADALEPFAALEEAEALDELEQLEELDDLEELEELEELDEVVGPERPTAPEAWQADAPRAALPSASVESLAGEPAAPHADADAAPATAGTGSDEDTGDAAVALEPLDEPDEPDEPGRLGEIDERDDGAEAVDELGLDDPGERDEDDEAVEMPSAPAAAPAASGAVAAAVRQRGPIRFRRPLPPGCKAPTSPPPAHPGRPPR
jgi:hypothetical protein